MPVKNWVSVTVGGESNVYREVTGNLCIRLWNLSSWPLGCKFLVSRISILLGKQNINKWKLTVKEKYQWSHVSNRMLPSLWRVFGNARCYLLISRKALGVKWAWRSITMNHLVRRLFPFWFPFISDFPFWYQHLMLIIFTATLILAIRGLLFNLIGVSDPIVFWFLAFFSLLSLIRDYFCCWRLWPKGYLSSFSGIVLRCLLLIAGFLTSPDRRTC